VLSVVDAAEEAEERPNLDASPAVISPNRLFVCNFINSAADAGSYSAADDDDDDGSPPPPPPL
jgi:hypothetical protein